MRPPKRTLPEIPVVDALAGFVHTVRHETIPESVIETAKRSILDSVGIAILGGRTPQARMLLDEVGSWGGPAEATVLGTGLKLPVPAAGLVGGLLCHSFDFDDTHLPAIIHPSACIVPAALATAEAARLSGKDALVNAVVGYEIMARIGYAASGQFQIRGFHATSICGAVAVGALAARALGGSERVVRDAIGCAVSTAAGILEPAHDGTWTKLLQAGWAVHGGLVAARLAHRGFLAPHRALDGEFGLYSAMIGDDVIYDRLVADLGTSWMMESVSIKLYPTCHHIHAFLDGALDIVSAKPMDVDAIENITLVVGEPQARIICEPWDDKCAPTSGYAARFSLPYAVARAMIDRTVALRQFEDDDVADPRTRDLMRRMRYQTEPNPHFPSRLGGDITVTLKTGETLRRRLENCRGTVEGGPITLSDVEAKFNANVGPQIGPDRAARILRIVETFETRPVADLLHALNAGQG